MLDRYSFLFGGGDEDDEPLGRLGTLAMLVLAPISAMSLPLAVSRGRGSRRPLADTLTTPERGSNPLPRVGVARPA